MINMRPYVPSNRIAIRDSIDEDISDDVDDEVFIKDSKTSKVISLFYYDYRFSLLSLRHLLPAH